MDPNVLKSPYDDPDTSRRIPRITAAIAGVVLATVAVVWAVSEVGDDPQEGVQAESEPTLSPVDASTQPDHVLVPYTTEQPLLTHPTILPAGWDACVVTEDRFDPDRFCDSEGENWIEVRYVVPRPSRDDVVPAGVHGGVWASESDPIEVRFPVNEHVSVAVTASGVSDEQVLEVAASVPMVGDQDALYGPYDLPIDWSQFSDTDFAGLLDDFEPDATVTLDPYELRVRTSNAALHGFNSRGPWTADAATDLPQARLVTADRPVVVGASAELHKGYAVWDQAGYAWRLEGNLTVEQVTSLALSVIAKLADLPKITDR